jgi:hypothetical protein
LSPSSFRANLGSERIIEDATIRRYIFKPKDQTKVMTGNYIKIIASDALKYSRDTRDSNRRFKALIGSCLAFTDEEGFLETYSRFIDSFDEFGNSKMVLKASEIRAFYREGKEKFLDVIENFIKSLDDIGVRINFCYSIFNSGELEENMVKIHGTDGISEKKINISEFIDKLYGYYSYVPAWKTSKIVKLHDIHVLIDCFTGEVTNAWKELRAHHSNIAVIPRGDQVDPYISASDIVTRYFNDKLYSQNLKLYSQNIQKIAENLELNNFNCFSVSNPDLNSIKPLSKDKITVQAYYPKMIYLVREGKEKEKELQIKERNAIENSPLWTDLRNEAYQKGYGLKYVDPDYDFKYLKENDDIIAYYGDIGEKKARYFNSLGHRILNARDLRDNKKLKRI